MAKAPRLILSRRSEQVLMLGPAIRILSALIDEAAWGCGGLLDTAILAEGDRAERWNKPKAQVLMERFGWRDDEDIKRELKLSPERGLALEMDIKGFTEVEIARAVGRPLATVHNWIYRDRLKMRALREDNVRREADEVKRAAVNG